MKTLQNVQPDVDFQKIFENCPDLFLLITPDLHIINASNAYLTATITRREDIIGRKLFEVFPDNPQDPLADGVSNLSASLEQVLQKKEPHAMSVQRYDIRKPDGTFEERFWHPLNAPVLGNDGEILYIIHKVEDVTALELARRDATAQLKRKDELEALELERARMLIESEARFHRIFNLCPIALFIAEVGSGKVVYVNSSFEHLFMMKTEDVVGKTLQELNATDYHQKFEHLKKVAEVKGRGVELELDLRIGNGDMRKILSTIEMIDIDGKRCFMVALQDITARKRMEDAVHALNSELEAFSYSVSHDLRAPLRAVSGYSKILEEDYAEILDEDGKRLLAKINHNAEKMAVLIDDLLAFSRLGRKDLRKDNVDMNALVASAISEIERTTSHHAKIEVAKLHAMKCDAGLMRQVVLNLVSNAVKYSSKTDNPIIKISSAEVNHEIVFSIQDNGVGFDMQYAHKLFGVFQRLHGMEEFEGTGVGLAIVQRIIQKHEGKVWANGKVDGGATFCFSIPKN